MDVCIRHFATRACQFITGCDMNKNRKKSKNTIKVDVWKNYECVYRTGSI